MVQCIIIVVIILNLGLYSYSSDLYQSYTLVYDPLKSSEWSDDRILTYLRTVRLLNYDHHIFQYRRYPCQYFYTNEIEITHNNDTINNKCIYNTTTSTYEYDFQLRLNFRHINSFILRNIAVQCKYVNCTLSLLKTKSIRIDWNKNGNITNMNCSFNASENHRINHTTFGVTDWITLRCESLHTCIRSKSNLEQALLSHIQLAYSSSYELEKPYCSLEKNIPFIIEANFAQTNRLLEQLVDILQRGFGKPNEREQVHMKEYVDHIEEKWTRNQTTSVMNTTSITGEVQGVFIQTKK